jgi:hypothetical protein
LRGRRRRRSGPSPGGRAQRVIERELDVGLRREIDECVEVVSPDGLDGLDPGIDRWRGIEHDAQAPLRDGKLTE